MQAQGPSIRTHQAGTSRSATCRLSRSCASARPPALQPQPAAAWRPGRHCRAPGSGSARSAPAPRACCPPPPPAKRPVQASVARFRVYSLHCGWSSPTASTLSLLQEQAASAGRAGHHAGVPRCHMQPASGQPHKCPRRMSEMRRAAVATALIGQVRGMGRLGWLSCAHMPVEAGGGAPAGRGPVGGIQAAKHERRAGHERRQRPLGLRVHPEQAVAVRLPTERVRVSLQRRSDRAMRHARDKPDAKAEPLVGSYLRHYRIPGV